MKPTDFAKFITDFLSIYLPSQKNVSKNTLYSYRDTFKLLLEYTQSAKEIPVEQITLKLLSKEYIIDFLDWLENHRNSSIATRNQRLAAIHSFFRYIQGEDPKGLFRYQKILSIPIKKRKMPLVEHLTPQAIKILLEQPDRRARGGRRDLTLLSVLYDSGARVQELIDIQVGDVDLGKPAVLTLTGKGNKPRRVPITKNTATLLHSYLEENQLNKEWKKNYPLFCNSQHHKLTRAGVTYIINKYVDLARSTSALIPKKIKAHMLRHSKAMHLLQAGINLVYIRDFLGHADIKTTEIYAKTDTETKRKAIENAYPNLVSDELPDWSKDNALLSWLSDFK